MRKPGGYLISFGVYGEKDECDSFTCKHCNKVVFVKPKCDPADLGGMCRICDEIVCPACVAKGVCDPLEEKLKRMEDRYHALRSYG